MPSMEDLTLEQQHALRLAAAALHRDFDGIFGTETIEQFLATSYDQFATNARIVTFLPLMAEKFARQRLRALAKVEGKSNDGLPVVLFLCVHNAGRVGGSWVVDTQEQHEPLTITVERAGQLLGISGFSPTTSSAAATSPRSASAGLSSCPYTRSTRSSVTAPPGRPERRDGVRVQQFAPGVAGYGSYSAVGDAALHRPPNHSPRPDPTGRAVQPATGGLRRADPRCSNAVPGVRGGDI